MTPATIAVDTAELIQLIEIATKLAQTIEAAISASNDADTLAAWNEAKASFQTALTETASS